MSVVAADSKRIAELFKQFFDPSAALQYYLHVVYPHGFVCPEHQRVCTIVQRTEGRYAFQCAERRHQLSIFTGSTLKACHLKLHEILLIFLCYYIHLSICKSSLIIGVSRQTISAFYSICNSALSSYACDHFQPIGGSGVIVQIDECLLRRRKYQKGKSKKQIWLFGGVESTPEGKLGRLFICRVRNRKKETLIPIIQQNISKGSMIWSDEWSAYACLPSFGYLHESVNHSVQFKNPDTGCCTNGIESVWSQFRSFIPKYGIREKQINSVIGSFLGFKNIKLNFEDFIREVLHYSSDTEEQVEDEEEDSIASVPIITDLSDEENSDSDPLGLTEGLEEPEYILTS